MLDRVDDLLRLAVRNRLKMQLQLKRLAEVSPPDADVGRLGALRAIARRMDVRRKHPTFGQEAAQVKIEPAPDPLPVLIAADDLLEDRSDLDMLAFRPGPQPVQVVAGGVMPPVPLYGP